MISALILLSSLTSGDVAFMQGAQFGFKVPMNVTDAKALHCEKPEDRNNSKAIMYVSIEIVSYSVLNVYFTWGPILDLLDPKVRPAYEPLRYNLALTREGAMAFSFLSYIKTGSYPSYFRPQDGPGQVTVNYTLWGCNCNGIWESDTWSEIISSLWWAGANTSYGRPEFRYESQYYNEFQEFPWDGSIPTVWPQARIHPHFQIKLGGNLGYHPLRHADWFATVYNWFDSPEFYLSQQNTNDSFDLRPKSNSIIMTWARQDAVVSAPNIVKAAYKDYQNWYNTSASTAANISGKQITSMAAPQINIIPLANTEGESGSGTSVNQWNDLTDGYNFSSNYNDNLPLMIGTGNVSVPIDADNNSQIDFLNDREFPILTMDPQYLDHSGYGFDLEKWYQKQKEAVIEGTTGEGSIKESIEELNEAHLQNSESLIDGINTQKESIDAVVDELSDIKLDSENIASKLDVLGFGGQYASPDTLLGQSNILSGLIADANLLSQEKALSDLGYQDSSLSGLSALKADTAQFIEGLVNIGMNTQDIEDLMGTMAQVGTINNSQLQEIAESTGLTVDQLEAIKLLLVDLPDDMENIKDALSEENSESEYQSELLERAVVALENPEGEPPAPEGEDSGSIVDLIDFLGAGEVSENLRAIDNEINLFDEADAFIESSSASSMTSHILGGGFVAQDILQSQDSSRWLIPFPQIGLSAGLLSVNIQSVSIHPEDYGYGWMLVFIRGVCTLMLTIKFCMASYVLVVKTVLPDSYVESVTK